MTTSLRKSLLAVLLAMGGCSGRPQRFEAPTVDAESAAAEAIKRYDADGDQSLSEAELAKCPAILDKIAAYDQNRNGSVDQDEVAAHLGKLLNGTGGTQLNAIVTFKGKALGGATVVIEPEPYLGEAVQAAQGVTDPSGVAALAIAPEFVPEHLRRLKTVHYGTFKVRITHPTTSLSAKYNADTELGYETEPGKPSIRFDLK